MNLHDYRQLLPGAALAAQSTVSHTEAARRQEKLALNGRVMDLAARFADMEQGREATGSRRRGAFMSGFADAFTTGDCYRMDSAYLDGVGAARRARLTEAGRALAADLLRFRMS